MPLTYVPEYDFARPMGFIPSQRRVEDQYFPVGSLGAGPQEFRQLEVFPDHFQRETNEQRMTSSCTYNALDVLAAFCHFRAKQQWADFSRMFGYYYARKIRGWQNSDAGATITDAFTVAQTLGLCLEPYWMFLESLLFTEPDEQARQQARRHRLVNPRRVPREAVKEVLSGGGDPSKARPVVFGITCYQHAVFSAEATKTGYIEVPTKTTDFAGGHALALTGFGNDGLEDWVEGPNSWGDDWAWDPVVGRKGWFRMNMQYVRDSNLSSDFWTGEYVEV